jgi:hypothetical protein
MMRACMNVAVRVFTVDTPLRQCYHDLQENAVMDYTITPLDADTLAFREYATREPLPLSAIQHAVLDFLRDREGETGIWWTFAP